MLSTLLSS